MAVFRIERTKDYTVMSNHHLRNHELSLKAKGLLSMMLSLPDDWNYGINALSNNLIMVDRKLLKNPNGLILGTPGSGKSFSAKREIANCFLLTNDDIIICDPEAEYAPLVERLHGQVIKISPTSSNYINPMDLNLDYSDDESPLSLKSDFILSLCELIVALYSPQTLQ